MHPYRFFKLHSICEVEGSRSKSLDQASHNRACCRRKISGEISEICIISTLNVHKWPYFIPFTCISKRALSELRQPGKCIHTVFSSFTFEIFSFLPGIIKTHRLRKRFGWNNLGSLVTQQKVGVTVFGFELWKHKVKFEGAFRRIWRYHDNL